MTWWFLILFIIIILLSFTNKEGYNSKSYYSNSEISAAVSSITNLKKTLKEMSKSLDTVYAYKLSANEIISKLNPILKTEDVSTYKSGVIYGIMQSINDFSDLQTNLDEINGMISLIKNYELIYFTGNDKRETLTDSLETIISKLNLLEDKLTKLPNS